MAVGYPARHHAPVPTEVQLQVPVGRHHLGADDVQQPLHGPFQSFVRPHLIQVGIGLQDVQVGVHGFVGIDVVGAQGHVFQRREIPGQGFHVASVFLVGKEGFHHLVQIDGVLEHFVVPGYLVEFAKAVDCKTLRIQLLLGIQALPCRIHAPVHTAVFVVAEMLQKIVPGMYGRHQVRSFMQCLISRRKRPDDAGVQDDAAGSVVQHGAVRCHFPVKAPAGILQSQPVRQDAGGQVLPDLLNKLVGSSFHFDLITDPSSLRSSG